MTKFARITFSSYSCCLYSLIYLGVLIVMRDRDVFSDSSDFAKIGFYALEAELFSFRF